MLSNPYFILGIAGIAAYVIGTIWLIVLQQLNLAGLSEEFDDFKDKYAALGDFAKEDLGSFQEQYDAAIQGLTLEMAALEEKIQDPEGNGTLRDTISRRFTATRKIESDLAERINSLEQTVKALQGFQSKGDLKFNEIDKVLDGHRTSIAGLTSKADENEGLIKHQGSHLADRISDVEQSQAQLNDVLSKGIIEVRDGYRSDFEGMAGAIEQLKNNQTDLRARTQDAVIHVDNTKSSIEETRSNLAKSMTDVFDRIAGLERDVLKLTTGDTINSDPR